MVRDQQNHDRDYLASEKLRRLDVLVSTGVVTAEDALFPPREDPSVPEEDQYLLEKVSTNRSLRCHDDGIDSLPSSSFRRCVDDDKLDKEEGIIKKLKNSKHDQKDALLSHCDVLATPSSSSSVYDELSQPLARPGAVRVRGMNATGVEAMNMTYSSGTTAPPEEPSFILTDATVMQDHIPVAIASLEDAGSTGSLNHPTSSKKKDRGRHRRARIRMMVIVLPLVGAILAVAAFVLVRRFSRTETDSSGQSLAIPSIAPSSAPSANASKVPVATDDGLADLPIRNTTIGEYLRDSGLFNSVSALILQSRSDKIYNESLMMTIFVPMDAAILSVPIELKFFQKPWEGHSLH